MAQNNTIHANECKCFAWTPVLVGALVAIGLAFLLNLFSVAIGLTAFTTNDKGVETLVLGGLLATGFGIIVSMFASGWLAGYLSQRHCNKQHLGALYGFVTWCLSLLVTMILLAHIQHYTVFYSHFLSGTMDVANDASQNVSNSKMSSNALVVSSYIMFGLFFISAFASSLGGHCGMRYHCKKS